MRGLTLSALSFCACIRPGVSPRSLPPPGAAVPQGVVVAVLPFIDKSEDPGLADIGPTMADIVTLRLTEAGGLRLVERQRLDAVLNEMFLGATGVLDPTTAARVGRILGASRMVMGSVARFGGESILTLRIVAVETGEIVGGETEKFEHPEDLSDAAGKAAVRLADKIR